MNDYKHGPFQFSSTEGLLEGLRIIREKTEHVENDRLTFPLPTTLVYVMTLERAGIGLTPVAFQQFRNWKAVTRYIDAELSDFQSGQFLVLTSVPHWRLESDLPVWYAVEILPGDGDDLESSLVTSCHNCKFNRGLLNKARRQIGNKCTKLKTETSWVAELPPAYQTHCYSFPMYPKEPPCPHFLWRRPEPYVLKWFLRQAGREEVCCFCKLPLEGTPEEDIVVHHMKPLARGGSNQLDNLEFAHRLCHDEYHRLNPA